MLKFLTGRHWAITQADRDSVVVAFHHGGTYTLDGDVYTETVEYANPNTAGLIKTKLVFKLKLDGDTLTQVGQGNPYTQLWKRAR